MLHTTKLLALFTLSLCCFSCKAEKRTSQKSALTKESEPIKLSPLKQQIMLMLQGKPSDESILRSEIESQGWKSTHRTFLKIVKEHEKSHGKKPEKIIIGRTLMRLSRINGEIELAESKREKQKSLEKLEKTIQEAIKEERSKPH